MDGCIIINNLFIEDGVCNTHCVFDKLFGMMFYKVDVSFHGHKSSFNTSKNTIFECHKQFNIVIYIFSLFVLENIDTV